MVRGVASIDLWGLQGQRSFFAKTPAQDLSRARSQVLGFSMMQSSSPSALRPPCRT